MKRFLIAVSVAILSINAFAGTITRDFTNLDSFFGIDISSNFDVTLRQGNEYSATVSIDIEMEEYLYVNVKNSILYVGIKGAPTKLVNRINSLSAPHPTLCITVPEISSIHLSGNCDLTTDDTFKGLRGDFDIFITGASTIKKLSVASGELEIEASGTSNACILADCPSVEIVASGVASLSLSGDCDECSIESSGSAKVTLIGKTSELDCECSGTSHVDADQFAADFAEIECSGAAGTKINVERKLEVSLSGVSSCLYRSNSKNLHIVPQIGRAASLKRL